MSVKQENEENEIMIISIGTEESKEESDDEIDYRKLLCIDDYSLDTARF